MFLALRRAALNRSGLAIFYRPGTRFASSTTEAAKETASATQSKAVAGLSRVASSVGSRIERAGGRTARVVGFVQSLIPPTIYYSKVGFELSKLVFEKRKMGPPDIALVQRYAQTVFNALRTPIKTVASFGPAADPDNIIRFFRSMTKTEWAALGVAAAEVIGFFSVGEMLGRFKLVGYYSSRLHDSEEH